MEMFRILTVSVVNAVVILYCSLQDITIGGNWVKSTLGLSV